MCQWEKRQAQNAGEKVKKRSRENLKRGENMQILLKIQLHLPVTVSQILLPKSAEDSA